MSSAGRGGGSAPAQVGKAGGSGLDRLCRAIDGLNTQVARLFGYLILLVTGVVIYEVVARGAFGQATLWANETTIYVSAVIYLVGGGYALLRRAHVRIDLLYESLRGKARLFADLVGFGCFLLYVGALIWIGSQMAWTSFLQREGTGTPWDPAIWPVKMAIPLAGVLLLLQGLANLARDLGLASPPVNRDVTP